MKTLLATTALLASLATNSLAQVQTPASLLMFPLIHNTGTHLEIVSVTNTDAGVSVLAEFIYRHTIPGVTPCFTVDQTEFLTPNDTISVTVVCHTLVPGDGYLTVSAMAPVLPPSHISFNRLVGSVISFDAVTGLTYTYDSIAIESPLPVGAPTDINFNGRRDLNGVEYRGSADTLVFDSLFALINPELCLVSLTGAPSDTNFVTMSAWNDNEFPIGVTFQTPCWSNTRMSLISPMFTEVFLLGTPHDPTELDVNCDGIGDFETGWLRIDSSGVFDPTGALVSFDGMLMGIISNAPGARHLYGSQALQFNGAL